MLQGAELRVQVCCASHGLLIMLFWGFVLNLGIWQRERRSFVPLSLEGIDAITSDMCIASPAFLR